MRKFQRPILFGVCFVKNEEDIIADSVTYAAKFCDKVFVIDNASTDRTWDIVNALDLDNLVPVCSKDFVFRDYLRLRFMETRKEELGMGNWWYIFDADEFLSEEPFETIALAEDEGADCIAVEVINFLLTKEESQKIQGEGKGETWRDRRWYYLYESGPVKLFKNNKYVDYGICDMIPFGLVKECSKRLPLKHYPHRSIAQLKKRIQARYGNCEFESECRRGTDLERYVIDPATVPQLRYWDEEKGVDLRGEFSINSPRIGSSMRDRTLALVIRMLYRLWLLDSFHALCRRYAAWRQRIDFKNEHSF
jgi:glycosyltransferase involved in cell wall biosynthesis